MFAGRLHARRLFAVLLLSYGAAALSYSAAQALLPKARADRANSPPVNTSCNRTGCHTPAAGADLGSIAVTGIPDCYMPGESYKFVVTVADPAATRWGFEIGVQYNEGNGFDNFSAGDIAPTAGTPADTVGSPDGLRTFVTHNAESGDIDGTYPGRPTSTSWSVTWTAPTVRVTPVRVYAAGIAANDNGGRTGDRTYLQTYDIAPCDPVPNRQGTWGEVKTRYRR